MECVWSVFELLLVTGGGISSNSLYSGVTVRYRELLGVTLVVGDVRCGREFLKD